jgi:predicted RNA-binding Zn ribbon-like protein
MERGVRETQKIETKFQKRLGGASMTGPAATSRPPLVNPLVDPLFVGDHPAMDLLNTIVRLEGQLVDVWQSDDDVLHWLVRTGLLETKIASETKTASQFRPRDLLAAARRLRDVVRTLVVARKTKKRLDLAPLNHFLNKGSSHLELTATKGGGLSVVRRYDTATPEALLAPLAEAAAEFLATADFDLVRACEGVDCVLWFYDRTKAHRRRWCSMDACGNRNKVARFRSRQEA